MRPAGRPELQDLTPYKTSDSEGGRVFLHANENPYPPPPDVVDEIFAAAREHSLNRYPPPATELVDEIASYAGVDASYVWIGDGSNEVLLQACLAYGGPGRTALLFEPTYRMHHRQARMAGTDVIECRRRPDHSIDPYEAVDAIEGSQPDIVFLCTPNNPTGTITPADDVRRIIEAAPGLVIVDEAYYEFCGETVAGDIDRFPNVIVSRTLSKAFRLASVRCGYGIARPDVLEELRRVRLPYAQSAFTQTAATVALRRRDALLDVVPQMVAERERVSAALAPSSEVFPSGANFVLFRPPAPDDLLAELAKREIVIRDFRSLPGCDGCLRVSIGTPEENDEFLDAVQTASH